MPRRIITQELEVAAAARPVDGYFDRVIKYIPADIVAGWTALTGLLMDAAGVASATLLWGAFVVFIVLTAAWTWKQTSLPGQPTARTQIFVATLAFIVWVFALGGPFALLEWYRSVYGAALLIVYTLAVGLVVPPEK